MLIVEDAAQFCKAHQMHLFASAKSYKNILLLASSVFHFWINVCFHCISKKEPIFLHSLSQPTFFPA